MRTRRKDLRATLAVMALWVALLPHAATAHEQFPYSNKVGIIGGESGFCVHGNVRQQHSWHDVNTQASNCNNFRDAWHAQKQEYYKMAPGADFGRYCLTEGWFQSPASQRNFYRFYGWDIWYRCNDGAGVNVWLTLDSWQYSWKSDWEGWRGGAWRPATMHCHCP